MFSRSNSYGCPRHGIPAHGAEDGPARHLVVTLSADEVAVVALVNVARGKGGAHRTLVDILHDVLN